MIDGHCHLEKRIGGCAEAMQHLYNVATDAGVSTILLLNLPELGFENRVVLKHAKAYSGFFFIFPSMNPAGKMTSNHIEKLKALGASGLKLHPRLHNYRVDSQECVRLVRWACELDLPIMVDGFPDGRNLSLDNTPAAFARLAKEVPDARIAIGHAGGHRILDALMVAKFYKNIYLDLSYTLLYYRNSTVTKDIAYAINSIRSERVFWGSDYRDRSYRETLDLSQKEFDRMHLSDSYRKSILEVNVQHFLGKSLEA